MKLGKLLRDLGVFLILTWFVDTHLRQGAETCWLACTNQIYCMLDVYQI